MIEKKEKCVIRTNKDTAQINSVIKIFFDKSNSLLSSNNNVFKTQGQRSLKNIFQSLIKKKKRILIFLPFRLVIVKNSRSFFFFCTSRCKEFQKLKKAYFILLLLSLLFVQ